MDLSDCESLEYVFLQSFSLAHLELSNCKKLKKVRSGLIENASNGVFDLSRRLFIARIWKRSEVSNAVTCRR